jgi:aldoxime dehydratase
MSKEPSEQRGLVSLTPSPKNMPPDWKPPTPAWAASFSQQKTPVVMAYFGTQFESGDSEQRAHRVDEFFNRADAPDNVESAGFFDRVGRRNLITSVYWIDPARYERWKDKSGFESWWTDPARLRDRQGHFR